LLSARHCLPPTNVSSVLVFAHCPFSALARSSAQLPSTYFVAPPLPHPPFTQSFISQPPVIFAVFAIISLDEPMHSSTDIPNSHARAKLSRDQRQERRVITRSYVVPCKITDKSCVHSTYHTCHGAQARPSKSERGSGFPIPWLLAAPSRHRGPGGASRCVDRACAAAPPGRCRGHWQPSPSLSARFTSSSLVFRPVPHSASPSTTLCAERLATHLRHLSFARLPLNSETTGRAQIYSFSVLRSRTQVDLPQRPPLPPLILCPHPFAGKSPPWWSDGVQSSGDGEELGQCGRPPAVLVG
jgi:hypothetical protein